MRRIGWALSLVGVVGFTAFCIAVDYGARQPKSWLGRRTASLAAVCAHYNPLGLFQSAPTTAPGRAAASRTLPQIAVEDSPTDRTPPEPEFLVDASEVVPTIRLDVVPMDAATEESSQPACDVPVLPASGYSLPIPPRMPRADESRECVPSAPASSAEFRRMPYAVEDQEAKSSAHTSWFDSLWHAIESELGAATGHDLGEEPPASQGGYPHMSCPYPFFYQGPPARPLAMPRSESDKSSLWRTSKKLLEWWIHPEQWFRPLAPLERSPDTMEFRPSDVEGAPLPSRRY